MEVKTFDISQLEEAKAALKEAFLREEYDENYNEWEFAQRVLQSPGYVPSLCLTAWQDGRLVGYNILTEAAIGESQGLAPCWWRKACAGPRRRATPGWPCWAAATTPGLALSPAPPTASPCRRTRSPTSTCKSCFSRRRQRPRRRGASPIATPFTMEMEISCKVIHETTQRRFAGKEGFTL